MADASAGRIIEPLSSQPMAVHFPSGADGLDAFAPDIRVSELADICRQAGVPEACSQLTKNIRHYLSQYSGNHPVRIPVAEFISGLSEATAKTLLQAAALRPYPYEPAYDNATEKLRTRLDHRLARLGPPPRALVHEAADVVEDIRLAKNTVVDFIMTSTYRIVISRVATLAGRPSLVITARDSDRQATGAIQVVYCFPLEDGSWEYHADDGNIPSSSFQSAWACHRHLELHRPDLAGALLHCHAREIICFDSALLERGLRINVLMPQLAIVAGTTRTENFGQAIAECFVGGANLVFRRGEGIWTAGNSAAKAADDAVRLTRDATSKHFALKDAETAV